MMDSWFKYLLFVLAAGALVVIALLIWGNSPSVMDTQKNNGIMDNNIGVIALPAPDERGGISVEQAIASRRSVREYSGEDISLSSLGQLLWSAQGITEEPTGKRSAPSAGLTLPMEVYVVAGPGVKGLPAGVYHYIPEGHQLRKHLAGDRRNDLASAALGQSAIRTGVLSIVVAGVFDRTMARYRDRGVRYVHMEAGHVGQNLHLQGESLGLGMVMVGAFDDDNVKQTLELPLDHDPLYIIPIGKK